MERVNQDQFWSRGGNRNSKRGLKFAIVQGAALMLGASLLLGGAKAFADDMDFGNIEAEQIRKGAPSLGEGAGPAAENTSTLSFGGASKWKEIKRNIGVGFFNYSNVRVAEINRGNGQLQSYNYPTFEYRTGRGEKVFVRPAFLLNSTGQSNTGEAYDSKLEWSDLYFGYSSYNIPWLPFEMDYKSEIRVYLPTSDSSRNEGMIARIRGDLKAHYPLTSRLTFLLWFKPEYFVQTRTAKLNDRGYARGTRDYGYELSANLYYQMRGGTWGLGGAVQHSQDWMHASVAENLNTFYYEDVSAQAFIGVNAFGFLSHIGAEQKRSVARPRDQFVAFRDTEMQYFARTYYRF